MKSVLLFGSTGSIGQSALSVIAKSKGRFKVLGLLAHSNTSLLAKQIKRFRPRYVCVVDEKKAHELKACVRHPVRLLSGPKGVAEFSSIACDIAIMGIVGIASLQPTLIAMHHTKRIALASKETFVVGGELITKKRKKCTIELLPVDSEINALFQLFNLIDPRHVRKLYLTASGGALFTYSHRQLKKVTPRLVLSHPTWSMGRRITVDSATLVNKGFEVIEAHYLFNVAYSSIDILIHRQSAVHAMLEMSDTTLFACMYTPTMKIPISHAFYYPSRCRARNRSTFSFTARPLTFVPVPYKRFPLLSLVIEAAKKGGNYPVVVNAADEVAVDYFLKGKITFLDIRKALQYIFTKTERQSPTNLESIYFWDEWARAKTREYLDKRCIHNQRSR